MRPERKPFFRFLIYGLAAIVCYFAFTPAVFADNWRATLYEAASPQNMVGVDKKNHTFNFFEKKSPLKLRYSYPCVTGQIPGDKQQINDLRTPEGVYFVEYKIANGLDFREYGGVAYTLNYPNPVDKLRGKTGHGIWIHSKGFDLVPTRGCVAINLRNIQEIGPMLVPGTPVVVAEELGKISADDNGTLEELRKLMASWSDTWASRSSRLFDFYEPDSYTVATENFEAFKQNKERLFKILSFIKIYNREIHALEGPGYWVTWAEQLYTASNLSTEGVRRLYWQRDDAGKFKIVGMEWIPRDVGMRADFQKGKLVAVAPNAVVSDASSEAPKLPAIDMPEQAEEKPAPVELRPAPAPVQAGLKPMPVQTERAPVQAEAKPAPVQPEKVQNAEGRSAFAALAEKLLAISEPLVPKRAPRTNEPDEILWGKGRMLSDSPKEKEPSRPTPQLVLPPKILKNIGKKNGQEGPADTEDLNKSAPAAKEKAPAAPALKEEKKDLPPSLDEAAKSLAAWEKAYQGQDAVLLDLYDKKSFNRLPESLKIPHVRSLKSTLRSLNQDLDQPWIFLTSRPAKLEINGPLVKSESEQLIVSPLGMRQGIQKLWWKRDEHGEYKIVGSDFTPKALGLEANYLDHVSSDVYHMLEDWRKAWESANLEAYLSFYAPNATQQSRMGERSIRRQKELLWSKVKPTQVQLTGLRLVLENQGIRADMHQAYADDAGKKDKGIKTMLLKYDGKKWLIQREDWVASQAAMKRP